jgi:hypothetical protein
LYGSAPFVAMVNSSAAAHSSPALYPPRPEPAGELLVRRSCPCLPERPRCPLRYHHFERQRQRPATRPARHLPARLPEPLRQAAGRIRVGCAFSSFQALIAVSRQSLANASSQPFSVSAAAASAAMAFHWKNGLFVEKIQRSSGLPE